MAAVGQWVPEGDAGLVWRALLDLRSAGRPRTSGSVAPRAADRVGGPEQAAHGFARDAAGGWLVGGRRLAGEAAELAELYLPVCVGTVPLTIGHLGQTLDGRIATESGVSRYVTGPANIVHLHRMRALCDAVLVGAETVRQDDPQLTTRLVPGDSPARVVVDPRRRLDATYRVFQDRQAPTLLVCAEDRAREGRPGPEVEVLGVPTVGDHLDLQVLRVRLTERGLRSVFVEGGGVTVSRFLQQGLLDRLHVAVAPLILGSGRHGLTLPVVDTLDDALRPRTRVFRMGQDVLFDCELRGATDSGRPQP